MLVLRGIAASSPDHVRIPARPRHVAMIVETGLPHHNPVGFEHRDDVEAETTVADTT